MGRFKNDETPPSKRRAIRIPSGGGSWEELNVPIEKEAHAFIQSDIEPKIDELFNKNFEQAVDHQAKMEAIAMLTKMPGESEVLIAGVDLPVNINLNDKGGVVFSTIRSFQGLVNRSILVLIMSGMSNVQPLAKQWSWIR